MVLYSFKKVPRPDSTLGPAFSKRSEQAGERSGPQAKGSLFYAKSVSSAPHLLCPHSQSWCRSSPPSENFLPYLETGSLCSPERFLFFGDRHGACAHARRLGLGQAHPIPHLLSACPELSSLILILASSTSFSGQAFTFCYPLSLVISGLLLLLSQCPTPQASRLCWP